MSIVIGNLKACRVTRGERYSPVNNVAAEHLPTYIDLVREGNCDVAIPAMQNRLVIIDIDSAHLLVEYNFTCCLI